MEKRKNFPLILYEMWYFCIKVLSAVIWKCLGGALIVTVIIESITCVQILDEAICVSLPTNALGKGMIPSVPSKI